LPTSWKPGLPTRCVATSFQLVRLVGCGLYEAALGQTKRIVETSDGVWSETHCLPIKLRMSSVMLNEAKTSRPRPISGGWGQGRVQKK